MILTRVGLSHRKGLHSGRKTARLSYFARGSFDFAAHRRTEHYGLIVETTGLVPPRGKAP